VSAAQQAVGDPRLSTDGERPGGDRTGTGRAWLTVARREVVVKLTDKAFIVGTVVTIALISVLLVVQGVLENRTHTYDVTVTGGQAASIGAQLHDRAHDIDDTVKVTLVESTNDTAARAAVQSEKADAWLHPSATGWTLTTRDTAPSGLRTVVDTVVRDTVLAHNAAQAGTTVEAMQQGMTVAPDQLQGNAEKSELAKGLGFAFSFLFYMAAMMFGLTLATSVVEEKQSRIVEMIAAALPLRQLLAGKVVGNAVLAFGQMALYVGIGLTGLAFTKYSGLVAGLSGAVVWFLVFFLVGFVVLSCMFAVGGALASRSEDLQSTTSPITILVMAIFFSGFFLEGSARTIVSYIPPASAVLMPVRIVQGDAAWWEPVVALALLVALGAVLIVLAERVYKRALLQTGGRISLKDALALEE
jgi:ABC-2 type transport system permease protein